MSVTVPNGGDYLVELRVGFGFDSFRLDDAIFGVLDEDIIEPLTSFVDVSQYVENFSIRRGRQTTNDQFPSGTATITINDSLANQLFNPFNTSSLYYDTANNEAGLAPLREVRISRDGQYLFKGRIQTFDTQYVLGGQDTITLSCADDLFVLARTELATFTPAAQTSSARITTILARPEVAFTGTTSLTASPVATLGNYLVAEGTGTVEYLNQISTAEQGRLFCNRNNTLVFQPRITTVVVAPTAEFNDTGTGVPYNDLAIEYDSTNVVNRASITRTGGITQVATNAASIAKYFTQAVNDTASLLSSDAQALTLATYLLKPNPLARFTSVQTYFGALSPAQQDTVATIDIGNPIRITSTESFGTTIQDLFVEGVEISVSAERGQTMRFYTSPATILAPFVLDDTIYGVLNTSTPQPYLS